MSPSATPPGRTSRDPGVIVLGSRPNGLVAACTIARADLRLQKVTDGLGGVGRKLAEKGRHVRQAVPAIPNGQRGRGARARW